MRVPGQRSQTVRCLLDRADVQALSDYLQAEADLLLRSGNGVAHADLAAAMTADGTQAVASRRSWDSPGVWLMSSHWPGKPHVLRVGTLAYRWVPEEYTAEQQRDFLDLARHLIRGLREVTKSDRVCLHDGTVVPVRLGGVAEQRARSGTVSLRKNAFRYRVAGSDGPGTAVNGDDEA